MKLLNLGCGSIRVPGDVWVNVDNLHALFPTGTSERQQLDGEPNYLNADITQPLPFGDGEFDGVLLSHVLEHFDAPTGLGILCECRRVLKSGGSVLVSAPDAVYFKKVYPEDRNENWQRLFDVVDPKNPIPTFFEAALWFNEHKAILTPAAVWCYLTRAGFTVSNVYADDSATAMLVTKLNRRPFSLEMIGIK